MATIFGRKHVDVQRFDEPGPNGGAYYNVYTRDDDSIRTVEFTARGAHLAEYEGEPRVLDAGEDRIQVPQRPSRAWKKPEADTPPATGNPQPSRPATAQGNPPAPRPFPPPAGPGTEKDLKGK